MTNIELEQELSQNFLDFSHEANCQRAFADARDGLKPGQRACLWEMFVKGYASNKPHVKSAKISGGTIASWWPHGDTAIYDTFARMSQQWINNIPEVDWHGANGSIQISGEPAASRYTEARLSKATEEGMLFNIKKHNVPMKLNFSEDDEWPEVFPALIPRLMINGCQGIGSTIANVWLPHSLNELAEIINDYLATEEIDYSKIAPSFPTGGIIINQKDLPAIYKTGKGKAIVRGKATIKDNRILITEIPYQVYVEPLIEQIKELVVKDELTGISNVVNKSDKKQLLIEVECDGNPGSVLNQLYKKTDLQKSFSANQFALVGKTPKLLTLKEYLDIYIQHNYDCIKRESQFELDKAKDRFEIVLGLIRALEDIDNIIALIKNSDSSAAATTNLISKYQFTEKQAKAIVDMKLGKLANLEKIELNQEKEELTSTIADCEDIINNLSRQKAIYLDRFNKFVKKHGDARRTELTNIEIPKTAKAKEIVEVIPEDVVVVMSQSGDIKRIPKASFKVQNRNTKGVKTQDNAVLSSIRTNTQDIMMLFSNFGKMYRILVDKIPTGTNITKGTNIATLINLESNERIVAVTSLQHDLNAKYVVFFTKQGLIKKTKLDEYLDIKKNIGTMAIKLKDNDSIANVAFMNDEEVIVTTENGFAIRFETTSIAATGRVSMGVKAINLTEGDVVVSGIILTPSVSTITTINEKGLGRQNNIKDFPTQGRGGKGVSIIKVTPTTGKIVGATSLLDSDTLLLLGKPSSLCVSAKDIPTLTRGALGNQMIKDSLVQTIVKL